MGREDLSLICFLVSKYNLHDGAFFLSENQLRYALGGGRLKSTYILWACENDVTKMGDPFDG